MNIMSLAKPKKVAPYGQTITGSPDVSGELRRARQTLAGIPSAIRVKAPRIITSPKRRMKVV